jgi:hypothetical protein
MKCLFLCTLCFVSAGALHAQGFGGIRAGSTASTLDTTKKAPKDSVIVRVDSLTGHIDTLIVRADTIHHIDTMKSRPTARSRTSITYKARAT